MFTGTAGVLDLYKIPMKTCIFLVLLCSALLAQPPGLASIPPETVVATVDGKDVTAGEIQKALVNMPAQFVQLFNQNPKGAVQSLFVMRYLSEDAEKLKLAERSPLKEQLELTRANAMAGARLNYEQDYYVAPPEAINEFYARNQAKYLRAKIKVISVAFKGPVAGAGTAANAGSLEQIAREALDAAHSTASRSEPEARQRAAEVVQKLRAGEDFVKLVDQYSDDAASKAAAGDFSAITFASSYPEEVKKAVFALNPGQVTDPLRMPAAFYIIRLEEKSVQPLSEVQAAIAQELRLAHVNEWFQSVTKRFEPTVKNPEFFSQPMQAMPPVLAPKPPAQ